LAVLSDILAIDNTAKVIIISGQSEKQNAIEAVGAGAYDFLCKPVEMEELRLLLRRCIHVVELEKEYHKLQQSQRSDVFEDMLGTSPQMQAVFALIRKVAGTNAPVLLLGESGTGKEMAAAAIHRRSAHKDGLLSPSTATLFLKTFWRVSYSATKKAPLPALMFSARDCWKQPVAAPCYWMRLASSPRPFRSSSFVSSGTALTTGRRPTGDTS
jgi:Response regulator containing CheY-like receiver, AAA-type ATPase, and DNA-binding domains